MPALDLKIGKQKVHLHKCTKEPRFGSKTILVEDNWDFVELWLRQKKKKEALFFWKQARAFHSANQHLTKLTSPLTAYYSALNATKALLTAKGVTFNPQHGVSGESKGNKVNLASELVTIKGAGVLPELCRFFGESVNGETYSLKDIFYNLAYIHRAFCITYKSEKELFIPITEMAFLRKEQSKECFFRTIIPDAKFQSKGVLASLRGMERDMGVTGKYAIRQKKTFKWIWGGSKPANLLSLTNAHRDIRSITYYIYGLTKLWYIKRTDGMPAVIGRSHMTLTLMALHRISEMSRYDPQLLERHFSSRHNWLLSQFLDRSLVQFIDECSAEITGHDFMLPGYTLR